MQCNGLGADVLEDHLSGSGLHGLAQHILQILAVQLARQKPLRGVRRVVRLSKPCKLQRIARIG